MIESCRNCKHSTVGEYDQKWKVVWWYCLKKKEMVPNFMTIICKEYENYESNLHDHNAARPSPQARDNGIHQKE